MENNVTHEDLFSNIKTIQGSSSLLDKGILPVSKNGNIPTLSSYYDVDSMVSLGVDRTEAELFLKRFGNEQVKKGCLGNPKKLIDTLLGRVQEKKVVTKAEREHKEVKIKKEVTSKLPKAINTSTEEFSSDEPEEDTEVPTVQESIPAKDLEFSNTVPEKVNVFTMAGISATGKGTRLSQLIIFLSQKFGGTNVIYKDSDNKNTMLGIYFKELDFLVYGKWVKSNKTGRLLSFSSHDWMYGYVDSKNRTFYEIMNYISSVRGVSNIAYEGYPCMVLYDTIHNQHIPNITKNVHTCYFSYPKEGGFELLQDRVVGRSGSRIKGTCWNGNQGIINAFNKHTAAISSGDKVGDTAKHYSYDAEVIAFGLMVLMKLDIKLVPEFIKFSKEKNTLRHLDNIEESNNKIAPYYQIQYQNLSSTPNLVWN